MRFDSGFLSRRSAAFGDKGAVATSTPQASLAGYDVLRKGGNAVDAAIAMAACLVVSEPTSNGLGSDLFAIVWDKGKLHGLNSSGRAPALSSADTLRSSGFTSIPLSGWMPVTVPGMVDGWVRLWERFGRTDLGELLEPAARLAEEGCRVPQIAAGYWALSALKLGGYEGFAKCFLKDGKAPGPGEIFSNANLARSLRLIAMTKGKAFYEGEIADAMDAASKREGGLLRFADLAGHRCEWQDPISVKYKGIDVYEMPPNGQGIAALMALGMAERHELDGLGHDDPLRVNIIAESLRLAFTDIYEVVADPCFSDVPVSNMIDRKYLNERARQIRSGAAASDISSGLPQEGGTVYLCAADADGMMVSLIQSNYTGFGSGIVIPEYCVSLQNRGAGFSLKKGHPNELMPGKRPLHTIIPGFLMKNGEPLGPFGLMGGDMQAQGHVQLVNALCDMGLEPQSAIDMPRFRVSKGKRLHLEMGLAHLKDRLSEFGYEVFVEASAAMFGGGQMIILDKELGAYVAGTESRKDGLALAF